MRLVTQLLAVAVLGAIVTAGWYYKDSLPLGFLAGGPGNSPGHGGSGSEGGPSRPTRVDVTAVRSGEIKIVVEAVGTAQSNESVELTTKVTGVVSGLHFTEGQMVDKGEFLVQLDPGELRAQLEENRAELNIARRLAQRAEELLKSKNIPEARVEESRARVLAAKARVQADEVRLAEYVIRAPFAGRLGIRDVSPGSLVRPGTRITTLDDTSIIKLDFEVPEVALARVEPGLEVTAVSAAFPDRVFFGRVATVDSRVDPVTRSIRVRAIIPNDEQLLKPGMFMTVQLVLGVRRNATLAPEEAVVTTGTGQFVFRIEDGKAARVPVTLGQRMPGEVEVIAGLSPGDLVVVGGVQKVRDGSPVLTGTPPPEPDDGIAPDAAGTSPQG